MKKEHRNFFKRNEKAFLAVQRQLNHQHAMMFMFKNGKDIIMNVPDHDQSPMNHVKTLVNAMQPDAYLFCSEVWITVFDKLKGNKLGLSMKELLKLPYDVDHPPKQFGDILSRKEGLHLIGSTKKGEQYSVSYLITRNRDDTVNKIIKQKPMKVASNKLP